MGHDLNDWTGIGRLTRDAELKYTAGGEAIANLALAVGYRKKAGNDYKDETSFFDVTLFGKTAESLKSYLVKGAQLAISGELRQDRWEQDGQKRSKVVILANKVQLLGGQSKPAQEPLTGKSTISGAFDDDIPF